MTRQWIGVKIDVKKTRLIEHPLTLNTAGLTLGGEISELGRPIGMIQTNLPLRDGPEQQLFRVGGKFKKATVNA